MEEALAAAAERIGKYEWMAAAELYREVLDRMDPAQDPLRAAGVAELQARCYFKAAFQSGGRDKFLRSMGLSQESQERAAALYEKASSEALAKRATARALFANFWLRDEPDKKRAIMEKCIRVAQDAAQTLEVLGNKELLAETYLDLVTYRRETLSLSTERKQLVDLFGGAVETAWRVIKEFQGLAEDQITLASIHALVLLYAWAEFVVEQPRYEDLEKKVEKLRDRIAQLAVKIGTSEALALASEASGWIAGDLEGNIPKTLGLFERAGSKGQDIGDSYLVGRVYTGASGYARWAALSEEFVEKRRGLLDKALDLASRGIRNLEPSSQGAWLKLAYGRYVEVSTYKALAVETDLEEKRALLGKAIDTAKRGIIYEKHGFLAGVGHELSKAMYFLATMDVGPEEKERLLTEALPIRVETVQAHELLSPHSWGLGVMLNYLALLKTELSKIQKDPARKAELLKSAASDTEQCVKLCATITGSGPVPPGRIRTLAQYNEWHGDILGQLYQVTQDVSASRQAIAAYRDTISHLSKSESLGPIPAVRWKIAQACDSLREYREASQSFHQAAEEYRLAGKKIPGLAHVFEDFAQYMEAWALIEDTRLSHDQELYTPAAEGYTKVASLLRATKAWSHLSKHYSACSFLELGEALSRQERQHAAIESFNAAQRTFQEGMNDLDFKLRSTPPSQERRELKDWLDVTQGRLKYSLGRAQLEEAKVLDARMEEEASSAKYRTASETFGALLSETHHEPTRRELETLRLLCDAWAKMKAAEARASPELYAEAADSFTRVERTAAGKRSRLAALANASMCRALESGSVFRRTRDRHLYGEIKRQLETAADFYEEADIKKAADWTRATQRLFDALTYLGEAEIETEPRKRTELYHLAEKHLQLAAQLYGDAGYSRKKEEALRHLERAREEKQLLLMPVEVLAESPAVGEVAVAPVSLTRDKAADLERFESANVVGSMRVSGREVHAGEDLTLELEMANIGKSTATLVRVENVASKGLEPAKERPPYKVEENAVSMRGKRLEYLKTHELKINLRARRRGTYEIRPRVVFVDEKGEQGSYEFGPETVTVRELGLLGWIRGES